MNNLLEIQNLNKSYQTFQLRDVSFSIPGGSIMGFVGENGSGKTTTIKLILNQIRRDSGSIRVFGLDNREQEQKIKSQIGVVFDDCYFPIEFKPADVGKMMKNFFSNWDDSLYRSYLSRFGLTNEKKVKELSKGMKMKLSIAAALAHSPKFLILDEATSGLDPVVRSQILELLLEFIQDEEHSILFSSHITADLEHIADYITFLHNGSVVFSKSKDDLLDSYGILKCGAEDFAKLDQSEILRSRKNSFECEALVADKKAAARRHPNLVIDHATIDDIMVFYGKEPQQ